MTVRCEITILRKPCLAGWLALLLTVLSIDVYGSVSHTSLQCQEALKNFLSAPIEPNFSALSKLNEDNCWTAIESSNAHLNKLNHLVEQGNRWAAQYLAGHLKKLDGGNLEDALRALGQFSDHNIERLLLFANEGLLSKWELSHALTMLPLSLTDRPSAQLALLKARRSKVLRVNDPSLSEQRSRALRAIDRFASEIRSKNSTAGGLAHLWGTPMWRPTLPGFQRVA